MTIQSFSDFVAAAYACTSGDSRSGDVKKSKSWLLARGPT